MSGDNIKLLGMLDCKVIWINRLVSVSAYVTNTGSDLLGLDLIDVSGVLMINTHAMG